MGAEEFRARSGRVVVTGEDGSLSIDHKRGYLSPEVVRDVEEWAQAKRDLDFGRWRSRLHPDFVVYDARPIRGGASDGIRVWNEREGVSRRYTDISGVDGKGATHDEVARAYFEAHPERKPWEDAKTGEVWAFVGFGEELAATVTSDARFRFGDDSHLKLSDPVITSARRIWPEDAS